ncbi:MAG: hydantoinase/carbamoylase family amidase [Planctomycetes bacterium]|nr:hydantoinase/carbamoylase family amidase [Planctomycetota bacterium]
MNPAKNPERISAEMFSPAQHIESHLARLATIGVQPDGSISRIAWTDAESSAIAMVRSEGEAFGLEGRYDRIGNLILALPGGHERRMLVGSHLDSVPRGGNYDGAAGVIAGLEAMRPLVAEAESFRAGIDLVVWRGEEHTYNAVYKGSAAAFGCSETHVLHNVYDGTTLRDAIASQGFDPACIDGREPSLAQDYIDSVLGYLELHIEQGVRLERENLDLGIVTSIAGDRRFLIVLEGRFDHSGATPMGNSFRSDSNLALAHILTRLDGLAEERRRQGQEFTQTVGIINSDPEIDRQFPAVRGNSVTKVSGLAYFTLDIMAADDAFMDSYAAEVLRVTWRTAHEFHVKAIVQQTDKASGLPELDPRLRTRLGAAAARLGYSHRELPSGAGHDAVVVALSERASGRIPVGMLFVPCRAGISHAPEEYVGAEQIAKGADVLRETLREVAISGEVT